MPVTGTVPRSAFINPLPMCDEGNTTIAWTYFSLRFHAQESEAFFGKNTPRMRNYCENFVIMEPAPFLLSEN